MGLFNNLFGSNNEENSNSVNWNVIKSVDDLNKAVDLSKESPIILFKHSTRCSISSSALNRLERNWVQENTNAVPFFLDLINHRDVSNEIADLLGVHHQSPQMILVKDRKAIFSSTHMDISFDDIKTHAPA